VPPEARAELADIRVAQVRVSGDTLSIVSDDGEGLA
jgi:hypothetical protein